MLFGRNTRKRLKPVRIMRGSFLNRPFLHLVRDDVCRRRIQFLAFPDRFLQLLINLLGQTFLHHGIVEHVFPKNSRYIY